MVYPSARRVTRSLLPLAVGLLWSAPALTWWDEGHQLICATALQGVQEETRRTIDELLARPLATECDWPDRIKKQRPATRSWHYLNTRPETRHIDEVAAPPEGDVISALLHQVHRLRDATSTAQRREALLWVAHLVGDLHQPMHLGYRDDLGGNLYRLTLPQELGEALGETRDTVSMHAVWDGLILRYRDLSGRSVEPAFLPGIPNITQPETAVPQWADETLAVLNDPLTHYREGTRLATLEPSYLRQNESQVQRQLQRAAARLAALLDWALAASK